jgi:hypothetical protein
MKRSPNESIDSYFNRFHELLDDLNDAEEPVPLRSAIRHFIFTLGTEFETIQSNYRIGNLPSQWNTQDWPTLLVLCRDYYNSVKSFGSATKDVTSNNPTGTKTPGFDRISYQKKVRQWFLNPQKFCQEIEKEQLKHQTSVCFICQALTQLNLVILSWNATKFVLPKLLQLPLVVLHHR